MDAINICFAIFRRNYHNQYFRAYPDKNELDLAKKIWFECIGHFPPAVIVQAAKSIIQSTEFLPTVRTMISHCENIAGSTLPDPHTAYLEACRASSPKAAYKWSHPLIYHTGKATDWYFLQSNPESVTFPVFKAKYVELRERYNNGEVFKRPNLKALPQESLPKVDKAAAREKLKSLKKALDL